MDALSVSTLVLAIAVPIGGVVWGLRAYRSARPASGGGNAERSAPVRPEQWGVRISAAENSPVCAAARGILGKEFPLETKPPLPLANCPFPHQCGCRYDKLFDRRHDDRRSGHDRRVAGQRFEKDRVPRRSGKDRRRKIDWY
jgi:hypothetical protein